jgi:4-hydroxy-2-oxoheptanedioate aldolase
VSPANALRDAIAAGRAVGTFVKLPSTASIDLAAELFDFAIVDREHSPLGEADALRLLGHAAARAFPALLRLPALDAGQINRALEAGAAGIQLSTVRTAAQARALREACAYAPHGTRSISLAHPVARYGGVGLRAHVEASAGDLAPLAIVQLESVLDRATYDTVLAERPDVAFVGTADLSVDAGFDDAVAGAAITDIGAAAATAGVPLGAFGRPDDPQVRYLVVSSDLGMLRAGMEAARDAAGPARPTTPDRGATRR